MTTWLGFFQQLYTETKVTSNKKYREYAIKRKLSI